MSSEREVPRRRLHPAEILLGALDNIREALIGIVVVIVLGAGGLNSAGAIALALAGILVAALVAWLRWSSTSYEVREGSLRFRTGLLSPDETAIPPAGSRGSTPRRARCNSSSTFISCTCRRRAAAPRARSCCGRFPMPGRASCERPLGLRSSEAIGSHPAKPSAHPETIGSHPAKPGAHRQARSPSRNGGSGRAASSPRRRPPRSSA